MPRHLRLVLALWLVGGAIGCSKCGKDNPPATSVQTTLTRYLPQDAYAVAVVPDVGALGEKLTLLEKLKVASFAAQLNGFRNAPELASALMAQIGVDLRSRESLERAGLNPAGGLAVVVLSQGPTYSVVAIKDEARLKSFLLTLSSMRLGAGVETKKPEGDVTIVTFSSANRAPALGYVVRDGFAFIAAGSSIAALPSAVRLPKEKSLEGEAALKEALQRLPQGRDLYAYVPSGSTMTWSGMKGAGAALSAHLSPEALTFVVDRPREPSDGAPQLVKQQAAATPFGQLPPESFLVARFGGDPKALEPHWERLVGPHLTRAFNESGFDFKAEVLGNLKPGMAAALALSPEVRMDRGMPALDPRLTNPFRFVHLVASAPISDPTQAQSTLEKLPALAPRFGARIEPKTEDNHTTYVTSYSQGEGVHLALVGEQVVAASPMVRLVEMRRRSLPGAAPAEGPLNDPALREVFEKSAVAMVVDLRRLAQSVKELPPEAWGIGGFAIKATTVRWLEATDDLKAITVTVNANEKSLQAEIALRLEKK